MHAIPFSLHFTFYYIFFFSSLALSFLRLLPLFFHFLHFLIIHVSLVQDKTKIDREAQICQMVVHPNIVQLKEFFKVGFCVVGVEKEVFFIYF